MIADYLEDNREKLVENKSVLELGAGAGLPSLTCAVLGASQVVVTDYPEPDLIDNLRYNVAHNDLYHGGCRIAVEGYLWGNAVQSLTSHLIHPSDGFDIIILADIIFNHSEHEKLIATLNVTMKQAPDAHALVFFTPYRPWLFGKDLNFFALAEKSGFQTTQIFEKVLDDVMFENDPGDELLRRTVFGYDLTRKNLLAPASPKKA